MHDEPFAVSSDMKRHIDSCAECQARSAVIAEEADAAKAALGRTPASGVDAVSAYSRFVARKATTARSVVGLQRLIGAGRRRFVAPAIGALAAAVLILAFVFTPIGTLAQNFLTIFEPRTFVAVNISNGELQYMPDLKSFGTMAQQGATEHREVATAAQASALTHIPARLPSYLPPTLPREAHYYAISPVSAAFQFSAARARAYAASVHKPIPPMPAGLDGSVLTIHAGPMIVMTYGKQLPSVDARHSGTTQVRSSVSDEAAPMPTVVEKGRTYVAVEPLLRAAQLAYHIEGSRLEVAGKAYPHQLVELDGMPMADVKEIADFIGENGPLGQHVEHISQDDMSELPPLVIVEAVAPRVYSTRATTREIEDYLLSMPGVAPQLADEIRAIGDPSTTMPIPVPIDKSYSQQIAIDGVQGLAIGDNTGVGGMIIWQKNGIVYGVCGTMQQRQLMEIAQSLR
jgi:hypothetical protein